MHAQHEHFGEESNLPLRICKYIGDVKIFEGPVVVFAGLPDRGEELFADVEFVVQKDEIVFFIHDVIHFVND